MIIEINTNDDKDRVHDQAIRFVKKLKATNTEFDIEVACLLGKFITACGVTQEELDLIYKE